MSDEKTTTEIMPPVSVTMIGTGDGLVKGAKAVTPPDQPNLVLNIVPPLLGLLVRFGHAYFAAVVVLVTAGMTSNAIPASDFIHLVLRSGELAFGGCALLALKDIVTIFGKLENKYPLLTGKV